MSSLSQLQPWLRPYAEALVNLAPGVVITSVGRSYSMQRLLYRRYLAGQSKYPAAPPGTSLHEQGRAFDLHAPDAVLEQLGRIWESWGGRWGARFNDPIHFEA